MSETMTTEASARKRQTPLKRVYDFTAGTVSYFERGADGRPVRETADRVYTLAGLPEQIVRNLALVGLVGRIDAAAADNPLDYSGRDDVMADLAEGTWAERSGATPGRSDLAQALVNIKMVADLETAQKLVASWDKDKRALAEGNSKVAKAIADIRAKRKGNKTSDADLQALIG